MRIQLTLLSVLCTFLFIPSGSAQNPANAAKDTRYLALGDSVAFGYNPLVQPVNLSKYIGYPVLVSNSLHRKVANASCLGETSTSFITGSAADDLPGPLGCEAWRSMYPLFVPYSGSQLSYAVNYLENNPNPQLVTINIGGNDLAVLQYQCAGDAACEYAGLPGVLAKYAQNLTTIFTALRVQAGYQGPITLLTYYAFNYSDPSQLAAFGALNGVASSVASAFNVHVADGFGAFAAASAGYGGDTCAAGLLVKLPNGSCDTHPSLAGQQVLANAVLAVSSVK